MGKAIDAALTQAKTTKNGKPTIIIAKTIIGKGIPEVEGTNAAHGEAGVPYQKTAREGLGLPADQLWYVDPETKKFFANRKEEQKTAYNVWQDKFNAWSSANPTLAAELTQEKEKKRPSAAEVLAAVPEYDASKNVATRQSGSDVLQH